MIQQEFINQIGPIIQRYSKQYGYKVASPIIAQACLESRYGQSGLAKYHNYFGMKAGSGYGGTFVKMKTKEEYKKGVLTEIFANFRTYPNMEEGVKGYFQFISTKRYANLKDATTPEQYLISIKADGYATSSSYVVNNMALVDKYNLRQFDGATIPQTAPQVGQYVPGKIYTLQSDLYVRDKPEGAKLKFDALTQDGKRNGFFDAEGCAILRKGTRISCKAVSGNWMMIPSGWVCIKNSKGTYII